MKKRSMMTKAVSPPSITWLAPCYVMVFPNAAQSLKGSLDLRLPRPSGPPDNNTASSA
jgi:hypothetical protein